MLTFIVQGAAGHMCQDFNPADPASVARAKACFRELTGLGLRAVALAPGGKPGRLLSQFDSAVGKVLFIPHLQGG